MHGFGFGTGRGTGFIHLTGLFMSIIDFLVADQIMVGVACSSKKQLIEQLAERAAELTGLCQRSLFEIAMRRERLGSTAIGSGIAIPHAVHQDLTSTMGIIAVLTSLVDFDAQDRKPVDIVCLVIGPQNADSDHLKCVSSVARSLRDMGTFATSFALSKRQMNFLDALETPTTLLPNCIKLAHHPCKRLPRP